MYLRNNNFTKKNMIDSYNRILTQKKYRRTSENPLVSEKAMTIRKGLRDLDTWDDNIDTVTQLFKTAESSLKQVSSDLYNRASTLMIQGSNTPIGSDGMATVGVSLGQTAEEMVDTLNMDFNARQMFGGASQDKTPFEIKTVNADWAYNDVSFSGAVTDDVTGVTTYSSQKVTYHDIDLTTIKKGDPTVAVTDSSGNTIPVLDANGNPTVDANGDPVVVMQDENKYYGRLINDDGTYVDNVEVPGQESVLVDIGLGASYDENGNYALDENTAYDTALHGFKMLGFGVDDEGFPTNLIQITLDASKVAKTGDINKVDKLNNYIDRAEDARSNILDTITELGVKYTSLDYYKSKNDTARTALFDRQNSVEGTDIYEDITEYYAIQAAYNASLQMGANILPRSIWDFI
jgi:flagellar hook-associated protein 3 FlgL